MFRRKPRHIATYTVETPAAQMRLLRTHMAAVVSELGTMRVQLGQQLDRIEHKVEEVSQQQARR